MSDTVPGDFAAYADEQDTARFTDWCRQRAEPDWTAAVEHPFTVGFRDGTIEDAAVRRYLVQDYAFLDSLVGAIGHALGDAPSMAAKRRLADFLGTLTDEENDYFERSFDALDVSEGERTDPDLTPTTRAFQDLLGRAAREGGYAETLAVLVPAEWIYREWAGRENAAPDRFYLAEWITLHDNPAFDETVAWLRRELDRAGAAAPPARQGRLARLFERTVELEVAFFDAAMADERPAAVTDGGDRQW
ncbi:transcriptional regulator [Halomicrobium mukohataei]|uniref:Transcriptional regulator n=1 Tax=Halomicrobium mukohataei TaxID=57705 RepID=A0A847UF06_9EURY|nr:TenA family protein [Halomicrobium mukohataei]NLV09681.1 transcriptional regulator [Halomicrobium mukohataei]